MKRFIKNMLLAVFFYSGLLGLYAFLALRRKAVVLTYHRVLPFDRQAACFSSSSILVTPETFDMHMRFVRRFLAPVSAHEFDRLLRSGRRLPPRTCLVTFDDGWYDNLSFALPILKRHGVPAILFVATDYVGSNGCFWQERLARMLYVAWKRKDAGLIVFGEIGAPSVAGMAHSQARLAIRDIVNGLKAKPISEIEHVVRGVEARLMSKLLADETAASSEDRFLTWSDVRQLHDSGLVSIGSHTASHVPLTKQDAATANRELCTSRQVIEKTTATECRMFAYPNGDFDDRVVQWVHEAGYAFAFTTVRGHVTENADAFRLKRINIHEQATRTPAAFLARIVGL
jgi:peptidoglycan/xylan/chitin deacetylase (PgdA/CDA1 family)